MPWHASVHPELPIIETTYSGVMTREELLAAVGETIALAHRHGTNRLLGDCTGLTGGHTIVDLFMLIDDLLATGVTYTVREAVLAAQTGMSAERVRFWETACRNRGMDVRVFEERDEALAWLMA